MSELASHPGTAAILAMVWAGLACLLPLVRDCWRPGLFWALVLIGVPLLGWLTFVTGPGLGVLFLALGLSLLVWSPLARLRRRHGPARDGVH